ncbi:MAG TPA: hypothetical protein VGD66_00615 [Allosphingosinicella sp.]|jgi:hypothetical protein
MDESLFPPPEEPEPEPARRLSTVERAFELARTGSCRTIEEIAAQLKLEQQDAVDAHLAGTSIRKDLRQICAEGRTARVRRAEEASGPL